MSAEGKLAQAPFDDARADLILRSKDEEPVLFRVYKSTLIMASPVFADRFSLPSQGPSGEVQVVDLLEYSETLDLSLRHIYPVQSPEVSQLHQVRLLAEFAHKYQVDALEQDIQRYLTDAIGHDPVGVFAIAVTYGYKDIGEQATRSSLNVDFSRLESYFVEHAPVELYWDLLKYHVACGKAASAVTSSRNWFSELSLGQVSPDRQLYGPMCLWNYLHRSAIILAHRPTANAITEETFIFEQFECTSCLPHTRRNLIVFSKIFGTQVQEAIARVPLPATLEDPRTREYRELW